MSVVFQNIYYKRTTATAKPCYICYRPTTTILATLSVTDFIYTCETHLSDRGFAASLPSETQDQDKPSVSQEEIEKVKKEWETKQAAKKEKAKQKETGDTEKKEEKKEETDKKGKDRPTPTPTPSTASPKPASPSPGPVPLHSRFALHRDIFAMRLTEHRKARQAKAAKELVPRLPGAPVGGL